MEKKENLSFLLNKFCSDSVQLSIAELKALYQLLCDKEEEEHISEWMQQRWEQYPEGFDDIDYERLFNRVKQQLQESKRRNRPSFIRVWRRYAAILWIPVIGLAGFWIVQVLSDKTKYTEVLVHIPAEQEYIAPPGMRSKITLPDSTSIWINADSRIIIAKGYGEQGRNVHLVGEAYFEVSPNEQLPFVVSTADLDIKVLGTTFNVSAYPNELLKTVLVEGSVEASMKSENSKLSRTVKMEPEQMLRLHKKDGRIDMENNVNTELYTSWKDGQIMFQKTPLEEVVRTLARWYNVQIDLKDDLLKSYRFTGTFDNRTLEQVMTYISLASSVSYKINKDQVTIYANPRINHGYRLKKPGGM